MKSWLHRLVDHEPSGVHLRHIATDDVLSNLLKVVLATRLHFLADPDRPHDEIVERTRLICPFRLGQVLPRLPHERFEQTGHYPGGGVFPLPIPVQTERRYRHDSFDVGLAHRPYHSTVSIECYQTLGHQLLVLPSRLAVAETAHDCAGAFEVPARNHVLPRVYLHHLKSTLVRLVVEGVRLVVAVRVPVLLVQLLGERGDDRDARRVLLQRRQYGVAADVRETA
mmetsp:Transcript_4946/g.11437  ORF Transcript_4946/g.11437 Transcript_4946/m.11437 type:complete len:225 (-) Transcript_4946:74-748(-)